ncbi:gluconokinase [Maritalea mediterranea]|uniref:Gluconokinase n=1 Tax=Maritalea mediterranea TaxID=2909667 RepID=A0ABS9E6Q2_9HYPH|nr:gluconokinase [Maritalea mediterranea]MCF4098492.1 gluconokinase [Maritalea mediterranea]
MSVKGQYSATIVIGVCGVGKTSVGHALALALNADFIEADDYHSAENLKAMASGIPLSDEMRLPWLKTLAEAAEAARQKRPVVMACSALKRSYRDLLRDKIGKVQFVFLHGDRDMIADRLVKRADHFMPVSLLDSQIATLEPPTSQEDVIAVDVALPKTEIVDIVARTMRTRQNADMTALNSEH